MIKDEMKKLNELANENSVSLFCSNTKLSEYKITTHGNKVFRFSNHNEFTFNLMGDNQESMQQINAAKKMVNNQCEKL